MGPLASYQQELDEGILQADPGQAAVVARLEAIALELNRRVNWKRPSRSVFAGWFSSTASVVDGVPGLYLWGGVGRGKTHLCDLFFDSLPFEDKTRLHFHRFMQRIHADLRELGEVEDPLVQIAESWSDQARLLLLDEIHVHDITDAMLLGRLLTELFKRGVTVVTTSNVAPDDLYKEGLQRARFLPAIAQIKSHTQVLDIGGDIDFRLRLLQTEPIYLVGRLSEGQTDAATKEAMQAHFDRLRVGDAESAQSVEINLRELPIIKRASGVVWFSFDSLCNTPRSTHDYIDIATQFHTVLISGIPVLDDRRNDEARRLVNLIDEFYDRNVKVVSSAEALPDDLYTGKRLAFEFVRAASRLTEMQTTEYLTAVHDPVL